MDIENKFPVYGKCNADERALIERAVSTLYGNIINKPAGDEIFVFKDRKAISPSPEHTRVCGTGTAHFTRWQ